MNKITQTFIRSALSCGLMVMLAVSAQAASVDQVQGSWKSVRTHDGSSEMNSGADEIQMQMQLKFDAQNHFQMNHAVQVPQSSDVQESLYTGDYSVNENQILASATTLQVSYQGQRKEMALNPPRRVLLEVLSISPETMTLRIGGDNLVVDFQRVP